MFSVPKRKTVKLFWDICKDFVGMQRFGENLGGAGGGLQTLSSIHFKYSLSHIKQAYWVNWLHYWKERLMGRDFLIVAVGLV